MTNTYWIITRLMVTHSPVNYLINETVLHSTPEVQLLIIPYVHIIPSNDLKEVVYYNRLVLQDSHQVIDSKYL